MKWLILVVSLGLLGCKSKTEFGECVGLSKAEADAQLVYEISTRNAIWTILGTETIIAPILWATDFAYCPVKRKDI
jgi:hypothetical protein